MNKQATIIGCGISGATIANLLANKGWKVTIYEKQNFIGGNCYDYINDDGILIHRFGPHIFHSSNDEVIKFINKFCKLNNYMNKVMVSVDNKKFPLPINFKSIETIMGNKASSVIQFLQKTFPKQKTITLFELAKIENSDIKELYSYLLKNVYANYTAKMWGKDIKDIDPNTINRVKIVLGYEHNYFPDDKCQGLPVDGYTALIKKMLDNPNICLKLNTNGLDILKFEDNKIFLDGKPTKEPIIYCGPLDEATNYKYGMLPYRSLKIDFETIKQTQYQDVAVVNYPADPKMTRIAEYKLMTLQHKEGVTTISREYPGAFDLKSKDFNVRYYAIVDDENKKLHDKYLKDFKCYPNFYPLGRLSQYKYFDMDDAIDQAMQLAKEIDHE